MDYRQILSTSAHTTCICTFLANDPLQIAESMTRHVAGFPTVLMLICHTLPLSLDGTFDGEWGFVAMIKSYFSKEVGITTS